jgi:hypothetical protein
VPIARIACGTVRRTSASGSSTRPASTGTPARSIRSSRRSVSYPALSDEQRTTCIQTWTRQVVQADGYGSAIRVILPIPLDTGNLVTLGVWLALTGAEWDWA